MTNKECEEVNVENIIYNTYLKLVKNYEPKSVSFTNPVQSLIVPDMFWHKLGAVYFEYNRVELVSLHGNAWVISSGDAKSRVQELPFNKSILAVKLKQNKITKERELVEMIKRPFYCSHLLLYGLYDGSIGIHSSGLGGALSKAVSRKVKDENEAMLFANYFAQETNIKQICTTFRAGMELKEPQNHNPELAGYLAKEIIAVLKDIV